MENCVYHGTRKQTLQRSPKQLFNLLRWRWQLGIAMIALILAGASAGSATAAVLPAPAALKAATAQAVSARLPARYDKVPLSFEPNRGQTDARVKFLAHGPRYTLFLTGDAAVLAPSSCAPQAKTARCWVRMQLLGANPSPMSRALRQLPGRSSYFLGSGPGAWHTGIPHFARAAFNDVYPGISLTYYGNPQHLEYDFEIAPYADASLIRLNLGGAAGALPLRVNSNGDLDIDAPGGSLSLLKPVAYQIVDGGRRFVASEYVLRSKSQVSLKLGQYDHSKDLIIDPALVYSTYLGGGGGDSISAIAVDGSGDTYVAGGTGSTNFPTSNPEQKSLAGASNVFITELKPDGTGLVFSTYVGGAGYDKGTGIALDSSGNVYVTGYTSSANFPTTTGVLQKSYQGGGNSEAFVLKLNAGGAALGYATYLGGSHGDFAYGIAVDSGGNAYVTGSTQSSNFPVSVPLQKSLAGGSDAFVAKLNPQGASLVYSTFLGGLEADAGQAIAVDSAGEAVVTGFTLSTNFPTQSPLQGGSGGGGDAFVAKLNAAGSSLVYSTYLGGSGEDRGLGVAVDAAGDAFVAGSTQSPVFPTTQGAYQTQPGGGTDAFVAELNPAGSQLLYSTLLGGSGNDQANGIALDSAGNAYVVGSTSSPNFPTANPLQVALGDGACASTCSNAFVSVLNPKGIALVYSTYLGGNGPDYGQTVAVDSSGSAYVAGTTASSTFPATGGVFQGTYAGSGASGNGFIAKVTSAHVAALALNPQSLKFGNQALGTTSSPETVTLTNVGSAPLSITGFSTSDSEFAETNTCNGSLAAGGAQCTASVTFTPSSTASTTTAITGTLSISDSAAGSPQSVALSGTGATPGPAITFSPSPLTFPGTPLVGTSSGPLPITLTNSGSAPLTITKVAISGSFTETDNCVATLQPAASCTLQVTFSPTITNGAASSSSSSTASNTGAITVTSNITGTAPAETVTGNSIADFTLNSTGPTGTTLVSAT
ncbi:MAG: SBBP repeat-containing protein, partial [Terriglobia bacterium]